MEAWISAITTVGFPIVACIAMAIFIYLIFKKITEENAKNMEQLQARCLVREDKLYHQLEKAQEINGQAISTIARYDEKLENIQQDIKEIKHIISQ